MDNGVVMINGISYHKHPKLVRSAKFLFFAFTVVLPSLGWSSQVIELPKKEFLSEGMMTPEKITKFYELSMASLKQEYPQEMGAKGPSPEFLQNAVHDVASKDPTHRFFAMFAIFSLAPKDPGLMRGLIPLLKDKEPALRFMSAYLIRLAIDNDGPLKNTAVALSLHNHLLKASASETAPYLKSILQMHIQELSSAKTHTEEISLPLIAGKVEIVITSAKWCSVCHMLYGNLSKAGMKDHLDLQVKSQSLRLPLRWVDIDVDTASVKNLELDTSIVPKLSIVVDGALKFSSTFESVDIESVRKTLKKGFLAIAKSQKTSLPVALKSKIYSATKGNPRIILIGTGSEKLEVPLFISESLKSVRQTLTNDFGLQSSQFVTLYGSGDNQDEKDSTELIGIFPHFFKPKNLQIDASFTPKNLKAVAFSNQRQAVPVSLYIFSGHGAPQGIKTWNGPKYFTPSDLSASLANTAKKSVIVSGNCYGGQFANVPACGFFAARPDIPASGCWESKPEEIRDYSTVFFNAFKPENRAQADFNGDGVISLEEAHWFASTHTDDNDIPYTSFDAVAEDAIRDNPELIPETVDFQQAKLLRASGTPGEQAAFDSLLKYLNPEDGIITLRPRTAGICFKYKNRNFEGKVTLSPFSSSYKLPVSLSPEDRADLEAIVQYDSTDPQGTNVPVSNFVLYRSAKNQKTFPGRNETFLENRSVDSIMLDAILITGQNQELWLPVNTNLRFTQDGKLTSDLNTDPLGLGTHPKLVQLLRRLAFKAYGIPALKKDSKIFGRLREVQSCESKSLGSLLGNN